MGRVILEAMAQRHHLMHYATDFPSATNTALDALRNPKPISPIFDLAQAQQTFSGLKLTLVIHFAL